MGYIIVVSRIHYGVHYCCVQDKLWATLLLYPGYTMGYIIVVSRIHYGLHYCCVQDTLWATLLLCPG